MLAKAAMADAMGIDVCLCGTPQKRPISTEH